MIELSDTSAVIDALGGPTKMGHRCGFKQQRICNWRSWDHFPTDAYEPIQRELAKDGYSATASLWRSVPIAVLGEMTVSALDTVRP